MLQKSLSFQYDALNRLTKAINPDSSYSQVSYDAAGNLATKTDAGGVTVTYSYDALNRLTKIDFPSDTDITYAYDSCVNGKGRMCTVTDQSGSTTYEYTKKGQIAKETRTIDGVAYLTQYTYDQNGNIRTVTYPSARVVTYNYANSRVTGVLNNSATLASGIT